MEKDFIILSLSIWSIWVCVKILFDVYCYIRMFNLETDSFYVILYLKIAVLSFFLYLLSFILVIFGKYKITGILIGVSITILISQLKYGTVVTHYLKDDGFNVILYTLPSSSIRKQIFLEYYNELRRMPPVTIYYGLEKSNITKQLKTERQKGNYAFFVGFKKALYSKFNLPFEQKWILFFEDDALFVPWYRDQLSSAMYWYDDYDMIWLDTTNSLGWVFQRNIYSRLSSVLFATNSLEKIAHLLEENHPLYVKYILNWTSDNPPYYVDMVLAHYCRLKILKCAHIPLSFHRGLKSSMGK